MEKDRKVRENNCTALGMWLFLCFGEGGCGGGGCSCSLCVVHFVWESSKKWT